MWPRPFFAILPLMKSLSCLLLAAVLAAPLAARADEGELPIKADDGTVVANHRITPELESQVEKLPGAVVAANPNGKVTLAEFYDLNCPYCRRASADIDALVARNPNLRLVLVPFPVPGIPSIQGGRVEFAVVKLAPEKFYEFHRKVYEGRGVIDGARALAAAQAVGLDVGEVTTVANDEGLVKKMISHVHLGDALKIMATPGFVIKGVAIVGYPGPQAMANIVASAEKCGAVVCGAATR
jgi:protein-disulfide isomerase